MSEEIKTEETKVTTKEKIKNGFKKVIPWVCCAAGAIGTGVFVHKIDKWSTKYDEDLSHARRVKEYIDRVKSGGNVVFHMDNESEDLYAKVVMCDKPDWFDDRKPDMTMLLCDEVESKTI